MGPLGLPIFHHCTKFGAKMLIDAEIMAQNRNPRWRPSAILDFQKSDFWAAGTVETTVFAIAHEWFEWIISPIDCAPVTDRMASVLNVE